MGSNYNSRSLPTEILVHGKKTSVVRRRQTIADIWANEAIADWQQKSQPSIPEKPQAQAKVKATKATKAKK